MTTECHCQETEIWLALHLWRFIFFKLFSPSSRMKEKLILAPLSGTTSLSEWTVSVIRQEAKNHLNFKSQVETFSTNSPLSYQFMLKLSLEKKQASTLTNNVSSHSSRWNFLRRRPLASRRLSRCARASRSPNAQRWIKFSTQQLVATEQDRNLSFKCMLHVMQFFQVSWEECSETCEDECSMMHFKEWVKYSLSKL